MTIGHIRIAPTADGSPTAQLGASLESMHSDEGALGETRFIYQPAVRLVWENGWRPRFISVGLGLGYNELMLAQVALARGDSSWTAISFEADRVLREGFLAWVDGKRSSLATTYQAIASFFGGEATRISLRLARLEKRWEVHGALTLATSLANPASAILFDAFSRRTSPDLWTETFLAGFLARAAAPSSFFVTYAASSSLKRVLRDSGFLVRPRSGFGRKRESTFASRGV